MFYLNVDPNCKRFTPECHCHDVHEDHKKHSEDFAKWYKREAEFIAELGAFGRPFMYCPTYVRRK